MAIEELDRLSDDRLLKLQDSKSFHAFMEEVLEVKQWIKELRQVAASEDYGTDFEHLQTVKTTEITFSICFPVVAFIYPDLSIEYFGSTVNVCKYVCI